MTKKSPKMSNDVEKCPKMSINNDTKTLSGEGLETEGRLKT